MPYIIPIVIAVAAVAGTATSVYGSIQQGRAQEQAAEYNAAVARNQAAIENARSKSEAQMIREKTRRIAGAQRAALAASGQELTSGTALELQQETAAQGELDYRRALWGGDVNAMAARQQAEYLQWQGGQASSAATIGAIGQGISGLGSAFSGYRQQQSLMLEDRYRQAQVNAYTGGGR